MSIFTVISYIGIIIMCIHCIIGLIQKVYQPQPMSYLIYIVSGVITLVYDFHNNVDIPPIIIQSFLCFFDFSMMIIGIIYVFKKLIDFKIKIIDWLLCFGAIGGFIFYLFVQDVFLASIVNCFFSLFATLINIRKISQAPRTEPILGNGGSAIGWMINALNIKNPTDFFLFGYWAIIMPLYVLFVIIMRIKRYGNLKAK